MRKVKESEARPHVYFLLDSDSEISYDIIDRISEIDYNKNTNFSVFIGCTRDKGIETFKIAKKLHKTGFPKKRTYLFPGNITQAPAAIFCNKTLAPELMIGDNKIKYNKYSNIGEIMLKSLGLKTEHFKYVVTAPGSSISKKLGVNNYLSDKDLVRIAWSIIYVNKRKPDSVYYEAGSGSKKSITEWKEGINGAYKLFNENGIRLNIGGGIEDPKDLEGILADGVVVSTAIEKNPDLINKFL